MAGCSCVPAYGLWTTGQVSKAVDTQFYHAHVVRAWEGASSLSPRHHHPGFEAVWKVEHDSLRLWTWGSRAWASILEQDIRTTLWDSPVGIASAAVPSEHGHLRYRASGATEDPNQSARGSGPTPFRPDAFQARRLPGPPYHLTLWQPPPTARWRGLSFRSSLRWS